MYQVEDGNKQAASSISTATDPMWHVPGRVSWSMRSDEIAKERLRNAAYPLVKLLQEDYDSKATVLIENDAVTLRFDAMCVTYPMGL